MSFPRIRAPKKAGTVLRAVPETAVCEPALLSDDHDDDAATTHQNVTHGLKSASSSPSLGSISEHDASGGWTTPTSSTRPDSTLKAVSSISSLRGAIGTYKNGRIQWRHKDRSSFKYGLRAGKGSKPKIHVVIPSMTADYSLPAVATSGHPSNVQVRSASAEIVDPLEVSPPSCTTHFMMRDSIVSPLNQRSISINTTKLHPQTSRHRKNDSTSTTSSVDSRESDASSLHSNHSSETSVEEDSMRLCPDKIFDSASPQAPSALPPRRYTHTVIEKNASFQPTCPLRPVRCTPGLARQPTITRKSSKSSTRQASLTSNPNMGAINQAITRSTSRQLSNPRGKPSPTLSEAEDELEEELASSTTGRQDSPPRFRRAPLAPIIPRKSSKRQSAVSIVACPDTFRLSRVPNDHIASQIMRGRSQKRLTVVIPEAAKTPIIQMPSINIKPEIKPAPKRTITPCQAETVILNILQSLDHFEDLFATAVLNRGFYRVFKRSELDLVKSVLRKTSPPAWEFREIAFPGHDQLQDEDLEVTRPQDEYTPSSYIQLQNRDTHIVHAIKSLIKVQCQSIVRPEISIALVDDTSADAPRIDDALWRIWSFCKTFGAGKGREEDIVAQMDWLRGGPMVHQKACTFSITSTDFLSDTLLSAPESFARGNEGGLTAEQLFGMMEMWNCLGVLLQGFQGRTAEARQFGVYDKTDVRGGDIDGEEMMLDEWCYYLLSQGLSTIHDLAGLCSQPNTSAFTLASTNGWTNWVAPSFGGTRRNFLKEAASRVYEDKIAHLYADSSSREVQRQQSKFRIQRHISALRRRKTSGERIPLIRMSQDRPMSEWENVISSLTREQPPAEKHLVSTTPAPTALAHTLSTCIAELPASPPRRTVAQPLLPSPPPSTVPSVRDRSSIATTLASISEHPAARPAYPPVHPAFRGAAQKETYMSASSHSSHSSHSSQGSSPVAVFQQHATQTSILHSAVHENTADKAIYRIVEMGFTAEQARDALRRTDRGDGLRVDSAVEYLLMSA